MLGLSSSCQRVLLGFEWNIAQIDNRKQDLGETHKQVVILPLIRKHWLFFSNKLTITKNAVREVSAAKYLQFIPVLLFVANTVPLKA